MKDRSSLGQAAWLTACACVGMLSAGCSIKPPVAGFVESPTFEPDAIERVTLRVGDGRSGAARTVDEVFTRALIARGYDVVRADAGGASASPLNVDVEESPTHSEQVQGTETTYRNGKRQQRTVYSTHYYARTTVRGEMTGPGGSVLWSSGHTASAQSGDSAEAARQQATSSAAAMVAQALPFRRLPIDKNGRPYDPRVTAPPR